MYPPMQYEDYSCKQISQELQRVSQRTMQLGGQIDEKADRDSVQMGVGLVLFWPTLFFIDGDGAETHEYARLKGEFEALEKVAIQKNCGIEIERPVIKKKKPAKNAPPAYPTSR